MCRAFAAGAHASLTQEYPRRRLARDRRASDLEEYTPVQAWFTLEDSDKAGFTAIFGVAPSANTRIVAGRTYGNAQWIEVEFPFQDALAGACQSSGVDQDDAQKLAPADDVEAAVAAARGEAARWGGGIADADGGFWRCVGVSKGVVHRGVSQTAQGRARHGGGRDLTRLGYHAPRGGQPSSGRGMTKVTGVSVGQGRLDAVTTSDVRGLEQLERAVLDDTASLASALRRCLMLAGYAHHEELRAWALKELEGYSAADELPLYRKVSAPLEAEFVVNLPGYINQVNTQRISVRRLPQSARERGIGESAPIRHGVRELEALIATGDRTVHLSPPGSAEYALEMTRQQQQSGQEFTDVTSLYWAVTKPSIEGVLDHIRTRLTQFVAEVRAAMPAGQQNPDSNQIESAAQQALNITGGDGSTFHISAPHAKADRGGTASADINEPAPATPQPWWHRTSVIWTAVAAVAAIAGVIATVIVAK